MQEIRFTKINFIIFILEISKNIKLAQILNKEKWY